MTINTESCSTNMASRGEVTTSTYTLNFLASVALQTPLGCTCISPLYEIANRMLLYPSTGNLICRPDVNGQIVTFSILCLIANCSNPHPQHEHPTSKTFSNFAPLTAKRGDLLSLLTWRQWHVFYSGWHLIWLSPHLSWLNFDTSGSDKVPTCDFKRRAWQGGKTNKWRKSTRELFNY